jgi:hypothetical protein
MRNRLLFLLILIAFSCDGQRQPAESDENVTLPTEEPAPVPEDSTPAEKPQDVPGPDGECPSCPPKGGEAQANNIFDVTAYGAKANDKINDLPAFQAAFGAARAVSGKIIIPSSGSGAYYLDGTWNILPDASNQVWVDVEMVGGKARTIRYRGPSNQPVIKIIGLKGAVWTGLNIVIEDGRTGVQIFDIDTTPAANSSSFNTFKTFYLNLGDGQDNIAVRTGLISGGGADISNYAFESIVVMGGGGLHGASIPGQYAYQNLGHNTLSMVWKDGFVAFCDRAYTNVSRNGSKRGNGSAMFYGMGGAHNNIDFSFNWEQSYIVSGGRWENGKQFMVVKNGGYSNIVVQGLTISNYHAPNNLFDIEVGCSLSLDNVFARWSQSNTLGNPTKSYDPVININVNKGGRSRIGNLTVKGGGFSSNELYRKAGNAEWNFDINGAAKVRIQYAEEFFPNETVRK